jgi:hypothetical protein
LPTSFSQIINSKGNFGNILSGRITPAQATQQYQLQQANQRQAAGQKQFLSNLSPGALLKKTLTSPGGLAAVFAALVITGKKLAEAQVEGLRHLQGFNGQIAAAYGRLAIGELTRTRQKAAATGGSTSAVVDAVNEMKDAWQPIDNKLTMLWNKLATVGARVFTLALKGLGYLAFLADKVGFLAEEDKKKQKFGPWQDTFIEQAKFYRDKHRPRGGK